MWVPELEAPSPGLAAALARLGATVRLLPHAAARAGGFTMKAATILLSGFEQVTSCRITVCGVGIQGYAAVSSCSIRMTLQSQDPSAAAPDTAETQPIVPLLVVQQQRCMCQVLFLDADNIAVRDPAPLFASPGYNATGALLWPDYWERSAAPDIADILGLDPGQLPTGTFESGQMALDKRRCGLLSNTCHLGSPVLILLDDDGHCELLFGSALCIQVCKAQAHWSEAASCSRTACMQAVARAAAGNVPEHPVRPVLRPAVQLHGQG